jgi:hypothetical protein
MAYPNEGDCEPMSAVEASAMVRSMIHLEASGPGDYEPAMERLSRKYGLSFWTLDHLRKRKAKTCDVGVYARIKLAFIDHCSRKAKHLLDQAAQLQSVGINDDLAAIEGEIRSLASRLEAAKRASAGSRK